MDYLKFVEHHRATNADITIGCLPVDYERASDFGLMKIDEEGRIFVSTHLHLSAYCLRSPCTSLHSAACNTLHTARHINQLVA